MPHKRPVFHYQLDPYSLLKLDHSADNRTLNIASCMSTFRIRVQLHNGKPLLNSNLCLENPLQDHQELQQTRRTTTTTTITAQSIRCLFPKRRTVSRGRQIMRPVGALGFAALRRDGTSKKSLPRYDEQPGRTATDQSHDMPCVCWSSLSTSFRILRTPRIISNTEIVV